MNLAEFVRGELLRHPNAGYCARRQGLFAGDAFVRRKVDRGVLAPGKVDLLVFEPYDDPLAVHVHKTHQDFLSAGIPVAAPLGIVNVSSYRELARAEFLRWLFTFEVGQSSYRLPFAREYIDTKVVRPVVALEAVEGVSYGELHESLRPRMEELVRSYRERILAQGFVSPADIYADVLSGHAFPQEWPRSQVECAVYDPLLDEVHFVDLMNWRKIPHAANDILERLEKVRHMREDKSIYSALALAAGIPQMSERELFAGCTPLVGRWHPCEFGSGPRYEPGLLDIEVPDADLFALEGLNV